ncbi:PREDICTED: probable peptidylglycine alpha-hydroxylating monooxygenase 1 [Priapulus caudatus]|uniref:peptidylglycine monooxygenase n=1 Tax=Priapulus caudatus TaxID=37621 RepID=A0ABM1EYG4_PRICU|nr:PREDICTED: probable peptidylglycine alpha-hydroxylating monooxygenase 1 [Priapulus caudatus]
MEERRRMKERRDMKERQCTKYSIPASMSIGLRMLDIVSGSCCLVVLRAASLRDCNRAMGFEPHHYEGITHHMLLFGCMQPGSSRDVWNCNEMGDKGYGSAPPCAKGNQIIYAWAMDAPKLELPEGVGFKVGGNTDIQYLVLQVHYAHPEKLNGGMDDSGLVLKATTTPMPKRAGVLLMGTAGELAPHAETHMETACQIEDDIVMHPFAYRTHTHSHGTAVSGYDIRDGEWREIGKGDPQKPQMFYLINKPGMTIEQGDIVAARCTMMNNENKVVKVGAGMDDEMCNFYIMYWVDNNRLLSRNNCFTSGPPSFYWSSVPELGEAPADASTLD